MTPETLALRFIAGVVLFGVLAILLLVALAAWLSRSYTPPEMPRFDEVNDDA